MSPIDPNSMVLDTTCPKCRLPYTNPDGSVVVCKDSPQNSDMISECFCWMCVNCWQDCYNNGDSDCPLCRKDVSDWLDSHYEAPAELDEPESETESETE